jgi:hypothetical protein
VACDCTEIHVLYRLHHISYVNICHDVVTSVNMILFVFPTCSVYHRTDTSAALFIGQLFASATLDKHTRQMVLNV